MEGVTFVLLCLYFVHVAGKLTLDVQPSAVDVSDNKNVLITCGLDLLRPKTNVVYSIMIKRRETTCAVLFSDGTFEIPDDHLNLVNFTLSASVAFLQLKLKNVTCAEKGNYSCKMAVRRSYRNLQLGPVVSPLQVKVNGTICAEVTEDVTHTFMSHDKKSTTTARIYGNKLHLVKVELDSKCTRTYISGAIISITATLFVVFLLLFIAGRCKILPFKKKTDFVGNDAGIDENHLHCTKRKEKVKAIIRTFWMFRSPRQTFNKLDQEDPRDLCNEGSAITNSKYQDPVL